MSISLNKKIDLSAVFLIFLALIFTTVFRVSLLLVYPVLVLLVMYLYKFRVTVVCLLLAAVVFFSWLISLHNGIFLKYNLLSLYYFVPFLLLLFSRPATNHVPADSLKLFVQFLTCFAILNDFFGIIQYIRFHDDDSFIGIYGRFTVTQNGLVILNTVLFFYYLQLYFYSKRKLYLWATLFFICCTVLGFYGAGMIVLFGAFALFYVRINLKSILKVIVITLVLGTLVYFLMNIISPRTLDYNINILRKFYDASVDRLPRKVLIFYNYITQYPKDILDLVFGSGPGTFNSRSAFMVGSPSYFNVEFVKSDIQPYYFKNFAYTLWNTSNITKYDGFSSQPFSSLLALAGEYGLLFILCFFYFLRRQYSNVISIKRSNKNDKSIILYTNLYKFFIIFFVLLLLIDNYMEYPEITGLFLILIKLTEQHIKRMVQNPQ